MNFPNWTREDFDAYEEKKWRSNRFNLERMKTREKLVEFHRILANAWASESGGQSIQWSHDHPTVFNNKEVRSQWCFSLRDEAARKFLSGTLSRAHSVHAQIEDPAIHHLHAILASEIDHQQLGVFWALHRNATVDRANWLKCLEDEENTEFSDTLKELPEGTILRMDDASKSYEEWSAWSITEWEKVLQQMERGEISWLRVGLWTSRETATEDTENFAQRLQALASPLGALHNLIHWAENRDRLQLHEAISEEKAARAAELARKDEKRKESAKAKEGKKEESPHRDEPASNAPLSILGDWRARRNQNSNPRRQENSGDDGGRARQDDRPSRGRNDKKSPRRQRRDFDGPKNREGLSRSKGPRNKGTKRRNPVPQKKWIETTGEVVEGARVRMKDGLFSGRDGDVIELNNKAEAKVLVGQFPTWVPIKSLSLLKED